MSDHAQIIANEVSDFRHQISELLRSLYKIQGVAVAVIATLATVASEANAPLALILVPLAAAFILIYTGDMLGEILAMAGYRQHLEEVLNDLLADRLFCWEKLVGAERRSSPHKATLGVIVAAFFVVLSVVSIMTTIRMYGPIWAIVDATLIAVLTVALVLQYGYLYHAYAQAYNSARIFRKGTSVSEPGPMYRRKTSWRWRAPFDVS